MAKKDTNKKKFPKFLTALLIIFGALLFCYGALYFANACASWSLRNYIKSFTPVEYEESKRILPTIDEQTGYVTFTTDDDLKVMVLTDFHIGGGIFSIEKDRKTVCEIITMLQAEKPDLVISTGDNTFPVPGPVFNGGGTLDNKMVARDVLTLFEHMGVYFTTTFGNHDTESFTYFSRQAIGDLYASDTYKYSVFQQDFTDADADMPSVTNQIILVKRTDGSLNKVLLMLDTNAYVDNSIMASINWQYDTLHQAQVDWAKEAYQKIEKIYGSAKIQAFFHIPIGEYQTAYAELSANNFNDTVDTHYVWGVWDELINEDMGGRVWYGGCCHTDEDAKDQDQLFETLGPDGLNVLEACFVGHDHVNNNTVVYRGVELNYNYSLDNLAYTDIYTSGLQRGCTIVEYHQDGTYTRTQKNLYFTYAPETLKDFPIALSHYYYDGEESPKGFK